MQTSNAYFGNIKGVAVSGGNDIGGLVSAFYYTTGTGTPTPEPVPLLLVLAGMALIAYQSRRQGKDLHPRTGASSGSR